ncbi:MAG: hydrogenase maturation protease [Gammaproteobacteria bacterium]|nr:hydrogenase maturation protease [Gammaproteobacteria bacterium]
MMKVRVIGIGSPFGDDRIGWKVVSILQQKKNIQKFIPNQLQIECSDRPGLDLLNLLQGAETAFLVDAVKTGASKTTIHRFENSEIEKIETPLSSHSFGIGQTLKLGKLVSELPGMIVLFGIEIENISSQFEISKDLQAAIVRLSNIIEKELLAVLSV